uniref:Ribosomal protein S10 n=1 Tax=Panagrellus redivivus TaxID=6233 RepID=A0A7E4VJJ3_PANRE
MLSNITFAPRDNSNVTTATQPTNSANLELYANLSVELLPHEKKGKRDKLAWDFQIEKRLRLKCVLNLKRLDFGTDAELFLPTLLMTPKSNWSVGNAPLNLDLTDMSSLSDQQRRVTKRIFGMCQNYVSLDAKSFRQKV